MAKQTAICTKIDDWLLDELDQYCKAINRKRNREINIAIGYYLRLRRIEAADPERKTEMAKQYIKETIGLDLDEDPTVLNLRRVLGIA